MKTNELKDCICCSTCGGLFKPRVNADWCVDCLQCWIQKKKDRGQWNRS